MSGYRFWHVRVSLGVLACGTGGRVDCRGVRVCRFSLARTPSRIGIPAWSSRGQVGVAVNSHWGSCSGSHATVGLVSVR